MAIANLVSRPCSWCSYTYFWYFSNCKATITTARVFESLNATIETSAENSILKIVPLKQHQENPPKHYISFRRSQWIQQNFTADYFIASQLILLKKSFQGGSFHFIEQSIYWRLKRFSHDKQPFGRGSSLSHRKILISDVTFRVSNIFQI